MAGEAELLKSVFIGDRRSSFGAIPRANHEPLDCSAPRGSARTRQTVAWLPGNENGVAAIIGSHRSLWKIEAAYFNWPAALSGFTLLKSGPAPPENKEANLATRLMS